MNKQNEQYYECYKVIYNSLISAYKDVYIIEALWELGKNSSILPNSVLKVLLHIRELTLSDLCSVLWKVSIDNDSKAASIQSLKKIVDAFGKPKSNKKFSPTARHIKTDIENIRNSYISHADQIQPKESVKINILFARLDEIRGMLNDMCYPDLDSRVEKMEDGKINVINYHVQMGLIFMVEGAIKLVNPSED